MQIPSIHHPGSKAASYFDSLYFRSQEVEINYGILIRDLDG